MKRVYVHNQQVCFPNSKSTVALDIDSSFLEHVKKNIGSYAPWDIPIGIGTSFCHPVDSYEKSAGRAIADSRVENVWFLLDTIIFKDDRICLTLNGEKNNVSYFLRIHVYRDTGNIRVIEASPEIKEEFR